MREMYGRMALAEPYLVDTESAARVAVLFSERTAISDSGAIGQRYFPRVMGTHSDIVRRGRPVDARYLDGTTSAELAGYRMLILPDARVLTRGDVRVLKEWVRAGGTLVASGNTSLHDEWGRPQADYGLADVFGVRYAGDATGAEAFDLGGVEVKYGAGSAYSRVALRPGAEALARWSSGDPAVVSHRFGRGRAILFTMHGFGDRGGAAQPDSGLFGTGLPGLPDALHALVDGVLGPEPVRVEGLPDGVEVHLRRKGGEYIVHLLDWVDGRTLEGIRIRWEGGGPIGARLPAVPGSGASYEPETVVLPWAAMHEMVVLTRGAAQQGDGP
jgi:hypothetical protein